MYDLPRRHTQRGARVGPHGRCPSQTPARPERLLSPDPVRIPPHPSPSDALAASLAGRALRLNRSNIDLTDLRNFLILLILLVLNADTRVGRKYSDILLSTVSRLRPPQRVRRLHAVGTNKFSVHTSVAFAEFSVCRCPGLENLLQAPRRQAHRHCRLRAPPQRSRPFYRGLWFRS